MSQPTLPLKTDPIAEIHRLDSGTLVIRPRNGQKLALGAFARIKVQVDGSFVLDLLGQKIEMAEAMSILGVPYSTLRRIIELGALKASKRSPGRWVLDLDSVLELEDKVSKNPDFWEKLNAPESAFQGNLKF